MPDGQPESPQRILACEDLDREAGDRPRSLRMLPQLCREAVRIVWQAGRRELIITVVLKLVNGAGLALVLLNARGLIDSVLSADRTGANTAEVLPPLAVVAGTIAALGILAAAGREVREVLSELAARRAKEQIIAVASAVELEAYETPAFHNLLVRAAIGGQRSPIQTVDGLIGLIGALAGIAGVSVALLAIQPLLVPLIAIAAVPLLIGVTKAGRALFGFHLRMTSMTRARNYLYGLLTEKDPAKEVRAFGLVDFLTGRHTDLYDRHMTELRRTARRRFRLAVLGSLGLGLALVASSGLLLHFALTGRIPLAAAGTAAGAMIILAERLMMTTNSIGDLYEVGLFLEDFTAFLALAEEVARSGARAPAPAGFRRLVAREVTFTYPSGSSPALQEVSIEINVGEIVALVGENGSGKTTLAKLLSRLYLPQAGRIHWDDVDTATVDPDQLRRAIAVIFQDFLHYALPARDNIGMGRIEAIEDEDGIVAAAEHAGAHPFLTSLPDGYDTILSPEFTGGRDLSVGQWQRVALARAFFRDAPFIILDEPTAALDPRAEHNLFASIRTLCRGRSVLLISHRFSSVRSADRIYVLHRGQVSEHGTHEELMTAGGRYAELFTLQAAAYTSTVG